MSPLAHILMKILKSGSWAAALALLLFAGILLWQRWTPEGELALTRQDYGFLAVLGFMIAFALYLVRAIGREIDKPGGG